MKLIILNLAVLAAAMIIGTSSPYVLFTTPGEPMLGTEDDLLSLKNTVGFRNTSYSLDGRSMATDCFIRSLNE